MEIDAIDLPIPAPGITAFSVKRSAPRPDLPYSGFNICHYTGDSPSHIDACRQALAERLRISTDRLIIPRQTHSANVAVINRIPFPPDLLEDVDALVTPLRGVALCINTADCVPLIMADPHAHIIAAAHCGWRGTVSQIARKTIDTMIALGADPVRIHAAMGPSICPRCFEVGSEVADQFLNIFGSSPILPPRDLSSSPQSTNNPTAAKPHDPKAAQNQDSTAAKPHIDLPKAIAQTLIQAGVPATNITPPPACSHCHPDQFPSARTLSINSARTPTLILQT